MHTASHTDGRPFSHNMTRTPVLDISHLLVTDTWAGFHIHKKNKQKVISFHRLGTSETPQMRVSHGQHFHTFSAFLSCHRQCGAAVRATSGSTLGAWGCRTETREGERATKAARANHQEGCRNAGRVASNGPEWGGPKKFFDGGVGGSGSRALGNHTSCCLNEPCHHPGFAAGMYRLGHAQSTGKVYTGVGVSSTHRVKDGRGEGMHVRATRCGHAFRWPFC